MSVTNMNECLAGLLESSPTELDLTNVEHLEQVRAAADSLLAASSSASALGDLESELARERDATPLLVHLAVKLAKSKALLSAIDGAWHVSIVFAAYKEHDRIRTSEEHPHGEDFLNRKISQLEWLFADAPDHTWDLLMVDDGCPEGSGKIAQEILSAAGRDDCARVLFLKDAIESKLPIIVPMASTSESQKGGSIQYGMWTAAEQGRSNHIIVFTDADLSTHLGQVGLLVDRIVRDSMDAAIGSRREPESIVVKKGVRNSRGKLFIYLWKRIITNLDYVVDTQCGFKAFRADVARVILNDLIERKFCL